MKCPNCGFDSNEKFCRMCGTKIPEQQNFSNNDIHNPYINNKSDAEQPAADNINPQHQQPVSTAQTFQYQNQTPFTPAQDFGNKTPAPSARDFQSQPPIPPAQNFEPQMSAESAQDFQPKQPPVSPAQNQYNYSAQGMPMSPQSAVPVPPQYYNQAAPQKSDKILPIVLSCIIIAVIIAGTVINVYSSCAYNKSIIESIINKTNYYDDNYDDYDDDYDYQFDDIVHGINDAAKFSDGTVTLTKVTSSAEKADSDKGKSECGFTFVIENTTDHDIEFYEPYMDVMSADDNEIYFDWLRDDIDYENHSDYNSSYTFVVKAGEKTEFTVYYSIPNNVKAVDINFNIDNYDDNSSFATNFSADLK